MGAAAQPLINSCAAEPSVDETATLEARLRETMATAVAAQAGHGVNFILTGALAWVTGSATLPIILAAAAVLFAVAFWRRLIAGELRRTPSGWAQPEWLHRQARKIVWSSAALGSYWGLAAAFLLLWQDGGLALFAAALGTGMASAGAITHRSYPPAAYAYVLTGAAGSALGIIAFGGMVAVATLALLGCYMAVLFVTIRANGERFAAAFRYRQELARSKETVQLLLNDVTEQGSEWLIEVDRDGRLINPCERMAEAVARPMETLEGMRFGRLLDSNAARDELKAMFAQGRTIRRHIVSLTVDGEQRWWAVSARPSRNGLTVYRGVVTDITAQRQAEQQVSYMAHYDGLTDLPNRFLFNERLRDLLGRGTGAAGVMYIDLDQFKAINDTLGHSIGDRLLQTVARRLEMIVSSAGMVARLGGDEFAVLLPPRSMRRQAALAANIVNELSQPMSLGDHDVVIGTSIGMAQAPQDGGDADGLLRRADLALYAAKAQGRGRAVHFDPAMDAAAQARRQIEMDLRAALADGQFRLQYQPMIDSRSGELSACEALIRWEHPQRGVIMPGAFIGVAEETGLIIPIGEWIIREALAEATGWADGIAISINLSPLQMRSPTLVSTIVAALAKSGIDPARLCLEITESVLMQDSAANVDTLHKLRDFGIQIALDDFGTGYSSLNYLRSFPFSRIKIDRCFIADIATQDDCHAIVRSVVDLAGSLGMSVVAEGVETDEQAALLRELGCQTLQGHLFCHAVPADELTDLRPTQRMRMPVTRQHRS